MKGFAWLLFVAAVIALTVLPELRDQAESQQIVQRADSAAADTKHHPTQRHEQSGTVKAIASNWQFSTPELQLAVGEMPAHKRNFFYTWSRLGGAQAVNTEVTGSATGVDGNAWFVNSYLVGYKPFDTNSVWEPLATLSLRKAYVLDHKLYGPNLAEVWQNSRQGFLYSRGDCEDHAIILADWLIAMGHRARVVLGKHRNQGHAWVVLFKDGQEYVLEATTKRRPKSIRDFKLAALATDYRPMYQFDRDSFWVNTGSVFTNRYSGKQWQERSQFVRRAS